MAEKGIEEMCFDSWRWQVNHPHGYEKTTNIAAKENPRLFIEYEDFSYVK